MMNFDMLWDEAMPIPIHAIVALIALGLGVVQLLAPKGAALHKGVGRVWVGAMAFVALSSFFIFEIRLIGPFSPIHLLSIFTLFMLVIAVQAARQGNIVRHKQIMTSLFWFALVLTGAFTLLPGRAMYRVVFGG